MVRFMITPTESENGDARRATSRGPDAYPDAAQHPVLIVVGDARGVARSRQVLRLERTLEIGRGGGPKVPGPRLSLEDPLASRAHARIDIDRSKRRAEIMDLGSRNGTVVDGRLIAGPTTMRAGALLFIGGHAAIFRFVT